MFTFSSAVAETEGTNLDDDSAFVTSGDTTFADDSVFVTLDDDPGRLTLLLRGLGCGCGGNVLELLLRLPRELGVTTSSEELCDWRGTEGDEPQLDMRVDMRAGRGGGVELTVSKTSSLVCAGGDIICCKLLPLYSDLPDV